MSKQQKRIEKIRNNPNNVSFQENETILLGLGFAVRKRGGSHFVFTHPNLDEILTVPYRKPLKKIYIKEVLRLIDSLE